MNFFMRNPNNYSNIFRRTRYSGGGLVAASRVFPARIQMCLKRNMLPPPAAHKRWHVEVAERRRYLTMLLSNLLNDL